MVFFREFRAGVYRYYPCKRSVILLIAALSGFTAAAESAGQELRKEPLVIAPIVEGINLCDEAASNKSITSLADAYALCRKSKLDGASAVNRLLNTLEPGGPKGAVQVGYTATLQLLALYQKTPRGWEIDPTRVDDFLSILRKVQRPVVVYLAADHFDSLGPISEELSKDPQNMLQLRDGKPLELNYFGYQIMPYTLSTNPAIPVNQYRFQALGYVAKKIKALPRSVQDRVVAYTLAGELHQMFPDFENGMGAYQGIQVTDYSPSSIIDFRKWLAAKYKSVDSLNAAIGSTYAKFEEVPAPSKDIRKEKLGSFGEHYDAFADGTLPIAGWLWDPLKKIQQLELHVDSEYVGPIAYGFNRLDVYRAEASITTPSTGFRYDLDFTRIKPGRHIAQVIAKSQGIPYQVAEVEFVVVARDQAAPPSAKPKKIASLKAAATLSGVRSWLDQPRPLQDVYYNPLAREWNLFREFQVFQFLKYFREQALKAGLPASKLFSHQIVPNVNSSWNPQLFAVGKTLEGAAPWNHGFNMYGGATDSAWLRDFMAQHGIRGYGVPEFNPQQWKREGVHLAAMQSHLKAGARFISPYYFSVVPARFKGPEQGVNRMELRPDNTADGSDRFYRAIIEFAAQ